MLSFIYNLVNQFESAHGMRPNLLYLNKMHLQHLQDGFSDDYDLSRIIDFIGLEIIIDEGIMHPHVAWTRMIGEKSAVC